MERTRLAVRTHAPPVVEAVGRVRALLHLVHHHVLADRVHQPAGNEERLARHGRMAHESVLEAARPHVFLHVGRRRPLPEPSEYRAMAAEHVPHLRLRLAAGHAARRLVRMHLDAQPPARVDDLEQQREPVRFRRLRADKLSTESRSQFLERTPGKRTFRHHRR